MKTPEKAYKEAREKANTIQPKWSHPAIKLAVEAVGAYRMQNGLEDEIKPAFILCYNIELRKINGGIDIDGEAISLPLPGEAIDLTMPEGMLEVMRRRMALEKLEMLNKYVAVKDFVTVKVYRQEHVNKGTWDNFYFSEQPEEPYGFKPDKEEVEFHKSEVRRKMKDLLENIKN